MHRKILFPVVLSASLLGCNIDLDQDIVDGPDTNPDTDVQDDGPDRQKPAEPGALDELVEDARDDLTQFFNATADEFTEIRGEDGTIVFLWPNSLETADGLPGVPPASATMPLLPAGYHRQRYPPHRCP